MKKGMILAMVTVGALLVSFSVDAFSPCYALGDFWRVQRRGANFFNEVETVERLQAAKDLGVDFVRLAPNKWLNGRSEVGDFLIGPPTSFEGIPREDAKLLLRILDEASRLDLKVVLTLLSLPGSRWKQHNGGVQERKIWQDFGEQQRAISFWRELATLLKGHPALVGYNILNEPSPEAVPPILPDWYTGDYSLWYEQIRGTPADLNLFYSRIVRAIREKDPQTPVILDSGFYASPWAFQVLEPLQGENDENVLYSFHMYEPFAYTHYTNRGRYRYPGPVPVGELSSAPLPNWVNWVNWDRKQIENFLAPVSEWQKRFGISSHHILAGEFGVFRENPGAGDYLRDVIDVLDSKEWHWAFYSFREDSWCGMNYELGPHPLIEILRSAFKK